jgi:hypothetical protein
MKQRVLLILLLAVPLLAAVAFVSFSAGTAEAAISENYQYQRTAQDDAKAAAVLLQRSDLPQRWKVLKGGRVKPDETPLTSKDSCDGYLPKQSDLSITGDAEARYSDSQAVLVIDTSVSLFKTAAMASADWSRESRGNTATCARQAAANARNPRESVVDVAPLRPLRCSYPNRSFVAELAYHPAGKPSVHYIVVVTQYRAGRMEAQVVTYLRKDDAGAAMAALDIHATVLTIVQPHLSAS